MTGYDAIRKQMVELWGKTVNQLEDISKALMSTSGFEKLKFDRDKLIAERDKLIKRLGEEIYKHIDAGTLKVPGPIQDIYNRIRKVINKLMQKERDADKHKASAKETAKKAKASAKATAKQVKTVKPPAKKKAKKPTGKKTARKSRR